MSSEEPLTSAAGTASPAAPDGPDAATSQPALALRGIEKSWGALRVLAGADLELARGERAWLGGRNGAGKTTLLRIAAGLIAPDAGEVRLEGLSPESERRDYQKRLGFLSAGNTGLYARLSVRDNLLFGAGVAFIPRRGRQEAVRRAVELLDLAELFTRRVDRLSMGQRQRVRVALALLHEPRVLLLDEPQTSLDDEALKLVGDALDAHAAAGGSTLVCAPAREHLGGLSLDTEYVLTDGKLTRT